MNGQEDGVKDPGKPRKAGRRFGRPHIARRYIASEYVSSFAVAFAFFFAVFFVNQLLLMAEEILSRKAPVGQVLLLLLFATPSIVAISFPFASLAGALMASGRLGADNEMLAFAASGFRTRTVFIPILAMGMVISLVSFSMNDYFLPLGTIEFGKLYRKLVADSPAVELSPWSVKRYAQAIVITGPSRGDALGDVLIFDTGDVRGERLISAGTARVEVLQGAYEAVLYLEDVMEQRKDPENASRFTVSTAAKAEYRIKLRERVEGISGTGPSEMSSTDLGKLIVTKKAVLDKRIGDKKLETAEALETLRSRYEEAARAPLPVVAVAASPGPVAGRAAGTAVAASTTVPSASARNRAGAAPATTVTTARGGAQGKPGTQAPTPDRQAMGGGLEPPVSGQSGQAGDTPLSRSMGAYASLRTQKPSDRTLQVYRIEFHKKFAIPAAAFFFTILAFPLGLGTRKAGRTVGFGLGLIIAVMYWAMLLGGQTIGLRLDVEPAVAIWGPNFVVLVAAGITWLARHGASRSIV